MVNNLYFNHVVKNFFKIALIYKTKYSSNISKMLIRHECYTIGIDVVFRAYKEIPSKV
jgi:hypothetical protein